MGRVAPKIGRVLLEAGEGTLSALKNWWKGPLKAKQEIEYILKNPTMLNEISSDISNLRGVSHGLLSKVNEALKDANKAIYDSIKSANSRVLDITQNLRIAERDLAKTKSKIELLMTGGETSRERAQALRSGLAAQQQAVNNLNKELAKYETASQKLGDFARTINNEGEVSALKKLNSSPDLFNEFPNLFGPWSSDVKSKVSTLEQINRAVSSNLNNDKQFVKEYIGQIRKLPENSPYRMLWESNPQNINKLESLRAAGTKNIQKILSESADETIARPSLGDNIKSAAKVLGLATGLTGAGWAAAKIYSLLSSHTEKKEAMGLFNRLNRLKVSGAGVGVKQSVTKALNDLYAITDKLNRTMDEQEIQTFTMSFGSLLQSLQNSMLNWNTVINNAVDKNAAISLGKDINQYINRGKDLLVRLGQESNM